MCKKIKKEIAQERLNKFNMTLVEYDGMSKPCVVECNNCGDYIKFNSCVSATTEGNKYGGNHGCRVCNNNDLELLKISLSRCEFVYFQMLEGEKEHTQSELKQLEHKVKALKFRINELEKE